VGRPYRLGRRQAAVDQTAHSILDAARELVAGRPSSAVSVGEIARRAGVSRISVYNRFGSRAGVLGALALPAPSHPLRAPADDPREALRAYLEGSCATWAASPALYRHLPAPAREAAMEEAWELAGRLAAADVLRPGCSLREAEDVIGALSSFAVFDRLHRDGRRTTAAVADVLMRMASGILA
jgi:AcrR family transcriptional regulator